MAAQGLGLGCGCFRNSGLFPSAWPPGFPAPPALRSHQSSGPSPKDSKLFYTTTLSNPPLFWQWIEHFFCLHVSIAPATPLYLRYLLSTRTHPVLPGIFDHCALVLFALSSCLDMIASN